MHKENFRKRLSELKVHEPLKLKESKPASNSHDFGEIVDKIKKKVGAKKEASKDSTPRVQDDPRSNEPEVISDQGSKRPRVKKDPGRFQEVTTNFTRVPNALLREKKFSHPLDFMVYMHLLSFSHGFHKPTCQVSMSRLTEFTGSGRNSIRRSLERLIAEGHIKVRQEFDRSDSSAREYEIILPKDEDPKPKKKGSSVTSGQDDLRSKESKRRSKSDPPPGSKTNRIKEIYKKNNKKTLPENLQRYLDQLPEGKRWSEDKSLKALRRKYTLTEISMALEDVVKRKEVHSPLAYLNFSIQDTLRTIESKQQMRRIWDNSCLAHRAC